MRQGAPHDLSSGAQLQRQICDGLSQRPEAEQLRTIRPGSITIIAARAHAGEGPPKVQVPRIDRYYGLERERLFAMVNAVIWEQMPDRKQYANEWLRLFFELNPPETPDPDGLAIAQEGVKYLRDQVEHHLESEKWKNDQQLRDLHHTLEKLLAANQEFALRQKSGKASSEQYADWRRTVNTLTARIIELSYGRITAVH